jgi:hypothetical protein
MKAVKRLEILGYLASAGGSKTLTAPKNQYALDSRKFLIDGSQGNSGPVKYMTRRLASRYGDRLRNRLGAETPDPGTCTSISWQSR